MIIFSNRQFIYVKHYINDQKIVRIPRAPANPNLPAELYTSQRTVAKPKIVVFREQHKGRMPNFVLITAWFNEIRRDKISWSSKEQRYDYSKVYSKDLGNVFIFGINTTMLTKQDEFIRCEFLHHPAMATEA